MMKKLDINGIEPKVGDMIVYNPPRIKGIVSKICVGFSKAGLPIVVAETLLSHYSAEELAQKYRYETPKTGFAVINITKIENIVHV